MRRTLGLLVSGWLLAGLLFGGCGEGKPPEEAAIGVVVPLTGPDSSTGREILNSVRLAADEWNQSGKLRGCQIIVAAKDDAGDPAQAATAAHQLYNNAPETLVGTIAHLSDACLGAAQKIYYDHRIAAISPGASDASAARSGFDNIFRIVQNDDVQAGATVNFFQQSHVRSVVLVHNGPSYGEPLAQLVKNGCEAVGIPVAGIESIDAGNRSFEPLLARIRAKQTRTVYFSGRFEDGGALLRQMREEEMGQQFIGGPSLKSLDFLQTCGEAALGCLAGFPGLPQREPKLSDSEPGDPEAAHAYLARYQMEYQQGASNYGPLAYDAANILIAAIAQTIREKNTLDREAIITAIQETNHKGITGTIGFDETGNTTAKGITFYEVAKTDAGELEFRPYRVARP